MNLRSSNWHERAFFGIHYDLHANAGDTNLGRDVTPTLLREAWEKIRPDWIQCDCKGHPGYTSWPTKIGYASPGIVHDALRIHREVTRAMGLPLVMHYSGIWDEAAIHHHPSWARVNAQGQRELARACPRGPYLHELLIPQMLEVIDEYDVDGFWVDGDIWATQPCYCLRCRAAFRAETGQLEPPRQAGQAGWPTWLDFQRRSYEDYARAYVTAVHQRKPACLMCINWLYSVRQPDPVTIPVDFLSGDFSHAWGIDRAIAEARVLDSRGLPWDLMAWGFSNGEGRHEGWHPKTVTHLCQEVSEVIANGGAICVYVQPLRSGHLVGWVHEVLAQVADFARARQGITQASYSVPQAAVLHAAESFYAHNDPLYNLGSANQALEGAVHALLDTGYHVDIRTTDQLLDQMDTFRLIVIPEQDPLEDRVSEALTGYVQRGGHLILSGAHLARHPLLAELAGVTVAGERRDDYHYLPVQSAAVTVAGPWQPVAVTSAIAYAALMTEPEPGRNDAGTAISVREVGRGKVAAIHGPIFGDYYRTRYPRLRALLRRLLTSTWPDPMVEIEANGTIHHTIRRQGSRTVIHLLNRSAAPAPSPHNVMIDRVPEIGPLSLRVRVDRQPQGLELVPQSAGLTWSWKDGALDVTIPRLETHSALIIDDAAPTTS